MIRPVSAQSSLAQHAAPIEARVPAGATGALRKLGRANGPEAADRATLGALEHLGRQRDPQLAPTPRQAAELMVSQLFYQPLLAEARETPFKTEIGSGGRGEDVFGEQLDLLLADRMAAASQGGLVEQLATRLETQDAAKPEPAAKPKFVDILA